MSLLKELSDPEWAVVVTAVSTIVNVAVLTFAYKMQQKQLNGIGRKLGEFIQEFTKDFYEQKVEVAVLKEKTKKI